MSIINTTENFTVEYFEDGEVSIIHKSNASLLLNEENGDVWKTCVSDLAVANPRWSDDQIFTELWGSYGYSEAADMPSAPLSAPVAPARPSAPINVPRTVRDSATILDPSRSAVYGAARPFAPESLQDRLTALAIAVTIPVCGLVLGITMVLR